MYFLEECSLLPHLHPLRYQCAGAPANGAGRDSSMLRSSAPPSPLSPSAESAPAKAWRQTHDAGGEWPHAPTQSTWKKRNPSVWNPYKQIQLQMQLPSYHTEQLVANHPWNHPCQPGAPETLQWMRALPIGSQQGNRNLAARVIGFRIATWSRSPPPYMAESKTALETSFPHHSLHTIRDYHCHPSPTNNEHLSHEPRYHLLQRCTELRRRTTGKKLLHFLVRSKPWARPRCLRHTNRNTNLLALAKHKTGIMAIVIDIKHSALLNLLLLFLDLLLWAELRLHACRHVTGSTNFLIVCLVSAAVMCQTLQLRARLCSYPCGMRHDDRSGAACFRLSQNISQHRSKEVQRPQDVACGSSIHIRCRSRSWYYTHPNTSTDAQKKFTHQQPWPKKHKRTSKLPPSPAE